MGFGTTMKLKYSGRMFNTYSKEAVVFGSIVLYRILLDVLYVCWINPYYDYYGFGYSFSLLDLFLSWVAIFFFMYFIHKAIKRGSLSDLIILFFLLMYYFPACTLFVYYNNSVTYFIYVTIYFFLMVLSNRLMNLSPKKRYICSTNKWFNCALWILALVVIVLSGLYTGFRISFDLSEFYELRAEARSYSMPTIFSYLYSMSMQIIPIGLLYALYSKKRMMTIILFVSQLLGFSFNGKKSVLFLLFLIIAIYLFYRDTYKEYIPVAFAGVSVFAYIETIFRAGNSFIAKHFVRRMMFIPAYLGKEYYDFFGTNGFDYLRSSILRRFGLESPYTVGIPQTIGQYVYSNSETNANTGLCGDAFANFGWLSLLLYPLLLVTTFKLLEKAMGAMDKRLIVAVAFVMSYTFMSGSYFTNLLTNGVILFIVLMFLQSPNNINRKRKTRAYE